MEEIVIRTATVHDAEELLKIYTPYVLNTAISFETAVPDFKEFKERIENTLKKYPYIVAVKDSKIIGYAYTSEFVKRDAYNHCAQTSIYIDSSFHRSGVGKKLYSAIEKISLSQNIYALYACIAYPHTENDSHLDTNSAEFHKHLGYSVSGRFSKCGYKFGTWYDMVWMEKEIAPHSDKPQNFIPFSLLNIT